MMIVYDEYEDLSVKKVLNLPLSIRQKKTNLFRILQKGIQIEKTVCNLVRFH